MATVFDSAWSYDGEIMAAMANSSVKNGEVARGQWPITADLLQIAALAGIPPAAGVSCEFASAAREVTFIAPPFATAARVVAFAAGSGTLTITATAGGTGTLIAEIEVDTDSGKENASLYEADTEIGIAAGDSCRRLTLNLERDGTGVQCYAIACLWGSFAL
jgi:hypothetical protein